MKIPSSASTRSIEQVAGADRLKSTKAAAEQGEQDGAKVSLSSDAMFVAELRDKIGTTELRTDLIAETKAEIANGTLETNVDMDQVIDGLLGDL